MAYRITKYEEAFEGVLGVKINDKIKLFIEKMEQEGHTEKSISFTIWKTQDKLLVYKNDSRFFTILESEINKWSWKKDDPRWQEYWARKNEAERAKRLRKELDEIRKDEKQLEGISGTASKKAKGYVYFIQGQCGGAIKIGYSVCPEKRLKELQTGYPDTLVILLMIPGSEATEHTLHREFSASRLQGEWFRPDEYLLNKIKEFKKTLAAEGVEVHGKEKTRKANAVC